MIFRVFEKSELRKLFEIMHSSHEVIGPVQSGTDWQGEPIYSFDPVADFDDLRLDYGTTKMSAKRFFMPFRETLATFKVDGKQWSKTVDFNTPKERIFFGVHACDINALHKLDKVLLSTEYPMPYYAAKRRNAFIIGIDCTPRASCFCRSMGSDRAVQGFDMFLTAMDRDRYFAEVATNGAFNALKRIKTEDPTGDDHAAFRQAIAAKNKKFKTTVDTTDLTKILDMEFQSDVWKTWGDKCLGCGTCASVCPTCYCYGVEESVSLDLKSAEKVKSLYSCNVVDFAELAGGHNFRKERSTRMKYRFYHKHRGFVEAYEESLCTGCGRCGEACLADITVPAVIASVRNQEG